LILQKTKLENEGFDDKNERQDRVTKGVGQGG